MPTGLSHIQEGQLDERVFSLVCNTWTVGPLSIEFCYDLRVPSVSVTVKLLGTTIGTCTINPSNPQCTVSGSINGFKAEVTVRVDFDQKTITLTVELCAPIIDCKDYSTTLHF
jgi:predicted amidohydrolase